MSVHRRRPLFYGILALALVWLVAGMAFVTANRNKITASKLIDYLRSLDLNGLSPEARAQALRETARKMNALPFEERRRVRLAGDWSRLFAGLNDAEKGELIEATMPSGFKQMLASFEQLEQEKRRRAVADAIRELKKAQETSDNDGSQETNSLMFTNQPPPLSEELQQKVIKIGLQAFYSQSSAQTKAELAPLLEEMQRAMESGRLFRGPRGGAGGFEGDNSRP